MKEGWEIRKLGDVCDFFKEQGNYTGLPYVGMEDISQFSNCFLGSVEPKAVASSTFRFDKGQVLYGRLRPYLKKILLADFAGHCSTEIFPIQTSSILSPSYLRYWFLLDSTVNKVNATCTGARMPRANMNEVLKFDIPVPPLSEQQRIVSKLDSAFEKIDALKANAENNLKNAKDLFQQVLKKELEPKEGWKIKKLKDVGVIQTGTTPSTQNKSNFGDFIPFIKPADISFDGIGGLNYKNEGLSEIGVKESRLIKSNSVLMVCIGATIGKTGFAIQDVTCNQQINAITPNEELDYKFCYYSMISPNFYNEIIKLGSSHQATLPIINKSKWSNLDISFPSLSEQQRIVSILDSLSEKCKRLEENYSKTAVECDALKQAVLREVISGE